MRTIGYALPLFALAGTCALSAHAAAPAFPTKPVRLVIGFAPGGGTDTTARALSTKLTASLGQQVIVDNRPGHSGTIAADIVTKATPDGHTVLLGTIAEAGLPGFEANNWNGFLVPAKTPRPIVDRLNKELTAALTLPDIKEFLFKQGLDAAPGTPEAFGAYIKAEMDKWAKVIKASGVKVNL